MLMTELIIFLLNKDKLISRLCPILRKMNFGLEELRQVDFSRYKN